MKINKNGNRLFGYFNESEFKLSQLSSEDYNSFDMDYKLIGIANYVRLFLGKTKINSCGRSVLYNASLNGSSPVSQHLIKNNDTVKAIDLSSLDVSNTRLHNFVIDNVKTLRLLGVRGIGFYTWGVHLDVRDQSKLSVWGKDSATMIRMKNNAKIFSF